jgi:hypothetical protein
VTRLKMIHEAVNAQAEDETLWLMDQTIGEAYLTQSLRWLHRVIESGDMEALAKIIAQSKDEI